MVAVKRFFSFVALCCTVQLSACAVQPSLLNNSVHIGEITPTPIGFSVPRHEATPKKPKAVTRPAATPDPEAIHSSASGSAPYGEPPLLTDEEINLTQRLFATINSDRAAHGLYPFTWNRVLSGGARLHSWNMVHCGFSHTCPDGKTQCQRIASEGFAGYTDCGENIAYAGPFPTAWDGAHNIQESMLNEPAGGYHRMHLLSTTLHRVGVGVYVDPNGYIWFTEDMVS